MFKNVLTNEILGAGLDGFLFLALEGWVHPVNTISQLLLQTVLVLFLSGCDADS